MSDKGSKDFLIHYLDTYCSIGRNKKLKIQNEMDNTKMLITWFMCCGVQRSVVEETVLSFSTLHSIISPCWKFRFDKRV